MRLPTIYGLEVKEANREIYDLYFTLMRIAASMEKFKFFKWSPRLMEAHADLMWVISKIDIGVK